MNNKRNNSLIVTAAVVVIAAAAAVSIKNIDNTNSVYENKSVSVVANENEDIIISADRLSENISFIDYNAAGTDMQFMLLKTDDGRIRCSLNTCQVCNGSPYAYFVQEGDKVICQNCGNEFALTQIGDEHGGCNPAPLEFNEENGNVVIDAENLVKYAPAFSNWKNGVS